MTQKDLADQLEKTSAAVGDYERGKAMPPLPIILQLCEIFNADLQTLVYQDLEGAGPLPPTAPDASDAAFAELETRLAQQQRFIELQDQRLRELEREIREQAPGLAARLGLGE